MIYLIRHTSVVVSRDTCYGQSNVAVAETFPDELMKLKVKLQDVDMSTQCYCSPLTRCMELARGLGITKPVVDDRLMEMDFGEWELKKWHEIGSENLAVWLKNFVDTPVPGGESYRDLVNRSIDFWKEITSQKNPECFIIAHSGVLHALVAHILRIPLEKSFSFHIDYGGVTKVSLGKRGTIVEYINR